ncbi:MAG: KpsF/GutQ family sugar-phosphate isomerase [Candidatus Ratteibacteria bacterium]|nr:KpsF/GutQ family sugar-phosphate isomerase [Candidatus Ratteibacteria bacterium]
MKKRNLLNYARDVIDIEYTNLRNLRNRLGKEFVDAVEKISRCKGKIILTGMGKSGIICRKIAGTFSSLGVPSIFLHPADAVHGDLGTISKQDIVIVISNSGETEEILRIMPSVKKIGASIISLTCSKDSSLGEYSDIVIETGEIKEADVFGLIPSSSTTCALVLGDAMALSLMCIRGVKKQDFAFFHPAGNLGKRLMLKVKDVMHRGKEIPSVKTDAMMSDVIREITQKNLGFTLVDNKNRRVVGIITDGDIRRLLNKKMDISNVKAEECMTKNPKTIDGECLAIEALSMMEKLEITCLVIVDNNRRAVGVVHLHDLLGKKEFKIEY